MTRPIPSAEPLFGGNEWRYVKECLDTNWVSSAGPHVERFESAIASYAGSAHAVATVSGTSAIHIALLLAGVGPGDEVLVPSLTFIATANAVRYCGAVPVFMDSEPRSWGIDPEKVQEFVRQRCEVRAGACVNRATGRIVKAILPVHLYGHPVDLDPLLELVRSFPIVLIEDAAEAFGARHGQQFVGTLGQIGCLSFNGNKIITSGGGGMLLTADGARARRARYLTTQARDEAGQFVHGEVGFNYRLSNLQAALGLAQLEQIDGFIAAKRENARAYGEALATLGGVTPLGEAPSAFSTFWMYAVLLDPLRFGPARGLVERAAAEGIGIRPLWYPLHRQPPYSGCEAYRIEVADRLYATGICLPSSTGITAEERGVAVEFLTRARP